MADPKPDTVALPVIPLRRTVLFPQAAMQLPDARELCLFAAEAALATPGREVLVVPQLSPDVDEPGRADLLDFGTRAVVRRAGRTAKGIEVVFQGVERVHVGAVTRSVPYLAATFTPAPAVADPTLELEALRRELVSHAQHIVDLLQPENGIEIAHMLVQERDVARLAYAFAAMLGMDFEQSCKLMEAETAVEAVEFVVEYLQSEAAILDLRKQIATRAQERLGQQHRETLLRQQLKDIHAELGDTADDADGRRLGAQLEAIALPDAVRGELKRELDRLARISPSSPEHGTLTSYLEFALALPWETRSTDAIDLAAARRVMDEDHLDLVEVKDRIIEHLATLKLNPDARAPILCFVGPPGTGKTSLGRSIARALGRTFERMSLGGLHDEAELRGHRRTYVGALPGRVLQAIRRAGTANPVLVLDEIDKLGHDFRGDPASAMLEILDPEQNSTFRDNYLALPFDLSKVFFITTANSLESIPTPLLDRMEVIGLSGYTEEQKLAIARRYLLPRQLAQAGVPAARCELPDATLAALIGRYTREAGLRQLERTIASVVRKIGVRLANGQTDPETVAPEELPQLLGPPPVLAEPPRRELPPGVATGLAWTPAGGEVIYVESTRLPGDRGLILTGQLGDVMQESARAAQSFLSAHASHLGLSPSAWHEAGVHVHVPAGATPKDGPSAGITLACALASLYSGQAVRADTAMTGELTLSGLVLPVGGIKDKVLAARRAGIRRVVLPRRNEPHLSELPREVRDTMELVLVDRVEDALAAAIPGLAFTEALLHPPAARRPRHVRALKSSSRRPRRHGVVAARGAG